MGPAIDTVTSRILAAAELWVRSVDPDMRDGRGLPDATIPSADPWIAQGPSERPPPVMVAGWEDSYPGCAPFVAVDDGADCGHCPMGIVERTLRTRRAVSLLCPNGVHMLAFPAPAGSRSSAAVLRIGVPEGSEADLPEGLALRAATRQLRDPVGLAGWQADQRVRGAERRRTAAAALAQMIATTEEFHRLYTAADRDRASSEQAVSRLDSLARDTLREAEAARTRVAHELHDTAAQSMISAHRFLEAARASLAAKQPDTAERHLDAAQERLLGAIHEVRSILNALVPPGLEELGLANALEILVRDRVPNGIAVEVTGQLPRLESWLESDLFAMAAEAVANAIIHAEARTLRIGLRASRGRSIITVTDDGIGFNPAVIRRKTDQGMGLMGITRRAGWLGGRVDVTSRPGEGTSIRISVPIAEAEAPARPDDAAPSPGASP
jgi:signal transduction histidine kinase